MESFIEIGHLNHFLEGPRRISINNRKLVIYNYKEKLFCTDANCYHSAGRLEYFSDDIEEILGQPCIRCPQHKYVISISTGESFYRPVEVIQVEENGKLRRKVKLLDWKSKGKCQRTHEVKVENDKVYVKLNESNEELPSDKYAFL